MFIREKSLDDLLIKVFGKVTKSKVLISSTRGDSKEIDGVLLQLTNPLARLSRTEKKGTVFSCLGELLWYLSGSKDLDFISYYISAYAKDSEDGKTLHGAYGPRLFDTRGTNQIQNVVEILKKKPTTRRAVIQIFDAEDLKRNYKEIPCTCTLQFLIRKNRLHLYTNMRSNDVYLGLPHDVFAFTMLQEILARSLNIELGVYKHFAGSLHIYTNNISDAYEYIDEGWQETVSMPPMPLGDPWECIKTVINAESDIRNGYIVEPDTLNLPSYWEDLVRLLLVFRYLKENKLKDIVRVKNAMHSDVYENYIRKKLTNKKVEARPPEQLDL